MHTSSKYNQNQVIAKNMMNSYNIFNMRLKIYKEYITLIMLLAHS